MSLRWRLALLIAALIALAVITQGAVGYVRFERLGIEEADRLLQNFIETRMRPPRGDNGRRGARRAPPRAPDANVFARVRQNNLVLDNFGTIFPDNLEITVRGYSSLGEWRAVSLDLLNGARLEVVTSLVPQRASAVNYLRTLGLTVPLLAGLGALAAWLLATVALKPLEALLRASSRVAESGDLSERVPHGAGSGELEQLSSTFNQMLIRLQGFREREISFTRTAAHELRTPLTAMQAQLDAESQGWATPAEALQTARNQVERMTKLSQALLLLAREGRTESLEFDLGALCTDLAAKHGAVYTDEKHFLWHGNTVLLERALENLLENAHKHAPNSQIRLQLEPLEKTVRLIVTDTGQGMTPEALTRASEAFYRAPGTKAYGSGLGLAVVARIAEAHGGSLQIKNAVPHGLRAVLEIQ